MFYEKFIYVNDVIQKYNIYINPSVRFVCCDEYCNTFNYLTILFCGGGEVGMGQNCLVLRCVSRGVHLYYCLV